MALTPEQVAYCDRIAATAGAPSAQVIERLAQLLPPPGTPADEARAS